MRTTHKIQYRWIACLILVFSTAYASYSAAATVIVTQTDDAPLNETPVFGSLRDAIENRASPGDTIVFDVRGAIRLEADLIVPRDMPGLTFQGPVRIKPTDGRAASISVEANDTTFSNMKFVNTSIAVSGASGGVARRLTGFALRNSEFRRDAQVSITEVDGCSVIDNTFAVRPRSGNDEALSTEQTSDCLVLRNEIRARTDVAFDDKSSTDLEFVDNNIVRGKVFLAPISGEIRDNTISDSALIRFPDFGSSNDLLIVADNVARSISATRTFVNFTGNTLSGKRVDGSRPPALSIRNEDPRGPQGPVLIENNTITGGLNGIAYSEAPSAAPAVIHDNTISGCRVRGILVNGGRDVTVSENQISNCGSKAEGRGIAVGSANASGVVVEDNTISNTRGTGILVVAQPDGIEVLVRNNVVSGSRMGGITLLAGDTSRTGRVRMEGNTLTNNQGDGVLAQLNTRGTVTGGEITGNRGDGISIKAGAAVEIRQVVMGGNRQLGIDIEPDGVTDNSETKTGNGNVDWPENLVIDPTTAKLRGNAAPGSMVEVFLVESGNRRRHPQNGEGTSFLGEVMTGTDGTFAFPAVGTIDCPATGLITLTATLPGDAPVTSEYSPDFDCVPPDDPPPVTDDDGDGVVNELDLCPTTPAGEAVDGDGCAESQKDDDQDGVANSLDQCPNTPAGEAADSTGCSDSQKDDDQDGVANSLDQCPNTPAGEAADSTGCSDSQKDDDQDGVVNSLDQCPNTPAGEAADSTGCSDSQKDDDQDGVVNSLDQCPNTPAGESVDANGCSASQLDSDADGVVDSVDDCADTPAGEPVDGVGCAESQKDDDNDGITNNNDSCEGTPPGAAVDSEGCAESQKDDDEDGVTNSNDSCPATPAGESVDPNGCAESQLDDDQDEVANADDRCENTPAGTVVNDEGCAGRVDIAGLGTVLLNDLAQSTIATGAEGEFCSNCAGDLIDATSHFCFASGEFRILGANSVASTGCDYAAPALTIESGGATVTSVVNEGVSCDGSENQCDVDALVDELDGPCDGFIDCIKLFSDDLIHGSASQVTRAIARKITVGGEGTFEFSAMSSLSDTRTPWLVPTSAGFGLKVAEIHFSGNEQIDIREFYEGSDGRVWDASAVCTNPGAETVTGENWVVLDSVPGEFFTTWDCEFTNTLFVDSDGDGVADRTDRCPGPGIISELGCQSVIGIPGLGTVYLNDTSQSSIATGQTGESCSDCLIELEDDSAHSCFDAGTLTITGPESVASQDCSLDTAAFAIDGAGATLRSVVDVGVACDGDANECNVTSTNSDLSGDCGAQACEKWQSSTVWDNGGPGLSTRITRVTVSKATVGADGAFSFVAIIPDFNIDPNDAAQERTILDWQVTTSGGTGDKVAEVYLGTESYVELVEAEQPEWMASVMCTNTSSGQQVAGSDSIVVPVPTDEAFSAWSCGFENRFAADTDGDGVADADDRCPENAGSNGNECPQQGDNGLVAWYCNLPGGNCSFTPAEGNCTDCLLERLDGTASTFCPAGSACVLRNNDELQCAFGGCDYLTPNLTGSCGVGALCTIGNGFSCTSNPDGSGCNGVFGSGETLDCSGDACLINAEPNVVLNASSQTARIDIRKATEGGDGVFTFPWRYTGEIFWFPVPETAEGDVTIQTRNGAGETFARFYIDGEASSLSVSERRVSPFELDRIECDSADGVTFRPEEDLSPLEYAQIRLTSSNDCTFFNQREGAQPSRVEAIPDGMQSPEFASAINPDAFGGAMNTTNPVVAVGTGSSEVFIDVVTGDVPRAGSDRLSFSGTGFPSFGVLVQPNDDTPGADYVRSYGPGSVTYPFNPSSGSFGFGQISFSTVFDLFHLGNDNAKSALISVAANQIDVLSPPDSTGAGGFSSRSLIEPENLQDATGQLISAQAFELGRLDCYNPCDAGGGAPMPAGCSAEIDQVIATEGFEFCADFWTPSCANEYSGQNGDFCALPIAERQVSFGGSVLALTDGTPGQIHLANPALNFFGRVETIASVGDDPRRVRCLDGICAVSNFGSGTLTILTWDGLDNAAVTETVAVGDGPVGIDLRKVGDNIVILSTGQNDNTYSVTTVGPDGLLLSNSLNDIPTGCEGPTSIIWVEGTSQAFATCNSNSAYAVFEP